MLKPPPFLLRGLRISFIGKKLIEIDLSTNGYGCVQSNYSQSIGKLLWKIYREIHTKHQNGSILSRGSEGILHQLWRSVRTSERISQHLWRSVRTSKRINQHLWRSVRTSKRMNQHLIMEVGTTMTMAIFYFELLGLHIVYAIACFDIKGNGLIRITAGKTEGV